MVQNFKVAQRRLAAIQQEMSATKLQRDQLIERFDAKFKHLRLPMRLRRRSGGQLFWRNTARDPKQQRDKSLSQYSWVFPSLPVEVLRQLETFEKNRLLINANLSLLSHEKRTIYNLLSQFQLSLNAIKQAET